MGAAFRPDHIDELLALTPEAQVRTIDGVGHQLMMMRGVDSELLTDLTTWIETL